MVLFGGRIAAQGLKLLIIIMRSQVRIRMHQYSYDIIVNTQTHAHELTIMHLKALQYHEVSAIG